LALDALSAISRVDGNGGIHRDPGINPAIQLFGEEDGPAVKPRVTGRSMAAVEARQ
jgi:hypothetical protein